MDDLYALDGGGAATAWQKRHQKRKAREAATKLRRLMKAEAKADLARRTKKWREKWEAKAAANKAAGLPPPTKHGRPRDHRKKQWVDLTGQRFGRQTVIRIAPISKSRGRNRRWLVRCDCGSGDRLVAGTNLRQGITLSCGCLKAIAGRKRSAVLGDILCREALLPLSKRIKILRKRLISTRGYRRADLKILSEARKLVIWAEIRKGLIKTRMARKPNNYIGPTLH